MDFLVVLEFSLYCKEGKKTKKTRSKKTGCVDSFFRSALCVCLIMLLPDNALLLMKLRGTRGRKRIRKREVQIKELWPCSSFDFFIERCCF